MLGRRLHRRIKHSIKNNWLKMSDNFGRLLQIECGRPILFALLTVDAALVRHCDGRKTFSQGSFSMKAIRIPLIITTFAACAFVFGIAFSADDAASKPKHTIKEVMQNANKGGLLKKVLDGQATPGEKLALLDHYISLLENKPPKGDMDSWNELAGKAALASAKVVVGRQGAPAELKNATNCAACHKVHK